MKKLIATASLLTAFFGCIQPNFAANHGTNPNLIVADYVAGCQSLTQGESVAESRNITVGNTRQNVVHLKAQFQTFAQAFITNSDMSATTFTLTAPIQFSERKGNANYFAVGIAYIPPGGTIADAVSTAYITATSKLSHTNARILASLGGGKYAIPMGGETGVPYGSSVILMSFQQGGNVNNCSNHSTDFNEITINKFPVGIFQSSTSCGTSCAVDDSVQDSND